MAGSWEIPQHGNVLCAILNTEAVTFTWSIGLRNLIIPGPVIGLSGMPFDHARNAACMRCLEGDFDYIFFLDSDVIPPNDAVLRLMQHNQPIVSGLYFRRSPPVGIPVMIKNGVWLQQFLEGLIEVDRVGSGCLLIHRSVLENFKPQRKSKHWFDWRVDMRGSEGNNPAFDEGCLSEDFTFCKSCIEQGWKILVDTTIKCLHVGSSQCSYNKIEPLGA